MLSINIFFEVQMAKKFKVKQKYNFGNNILRVIGKMAKRDPKILNTNENAIEDKCIMIGNHSGAGGPFTYKQAVPKQFMSWGAHQMCEGFKSRWNYLYHIFYQKKKGWKKFPAFIMATLFGMISRGVYDYAGIIPVYYDNRVKNTFRYSFECIEKNVAVFIFPENSNDGYKKVLEEFYGGFITLSRMYYKKYGVDLPIYTMYYSNAKKARKIIIGKPIYANELLKTKSEEEVINIYKDYMNSLYFDYAEADFKKLEQTQKKKKVK